MLKLPAEKERGEVSADDGQDADGQETCAQGNRESRHCDYPHQDERDILRQEVEIAIAGE